MGIRNYSILFFALIIGAVIFFTSNADVTSFRPLPWDMSHHYLGALGIKGAVASGSLETVFKVLLESDLYPPGHSIVLGLWLFVFGESNASWVMFFLFTLWGVLFSLWLVFSEREHESQNSIKFLASGVLVLSTIPVVVLSCSFMIDVMAGTLVLFSIWALDKVGTRLRSKEVLLALFFMAATLLTKYNIGLPLIPAAALFSVFRFFQNRKKEARSIAMVSILAMVVWVGFLLVQVDGWVQFTKFAENRANSQDWSFLSRLGWYFKIYAMQYLASLPLAITVGFVCSFGLMKWRHPIVFLTVSYIAFTLLALGNHSYLLGRNLIAIVLLVPVLFGFGVNQLFLITRRFLPIPEKAYQGLGIILALLILFSSNSELTKASTNQYASSSLVRPVSKFLEEQFSVARSCRVVGSFNNLSPGWMRVLWGGNNQAKKRLVVEFPYPFGKDRTGWNSQKSPEYLKRMTHWQNNGPERTLITIELDPHSPLMDDGFQRWSLWKENFSRSAKELEKFYCTEECYFPESGINVCVYKLRGAEIEYWDGWGHSEKWGIWALDQVATVSLSPKSYPAFLKFSVASFEGPKGQQNCIVGIDGQNVLEIKIDGAPWQWKEVVIELPENMAAQHHVQFTFNGLWPGSKLDQKLRALPFKDIVLEYP